MSDRYDDIISDMYKDAHGSRPGVTWLRYFETASDEEQDSIVAGLQEAIEESIRQDEEGYKLAIAKFEETIAKLIEDGAKDRETAVKWFVQSFGQVQDAGEICYEFGLPFYRGYEIEFHPHILQRDYPE